MAEGNHDVPAPSEAQPLIHAKYQDVQVARLQAQISQLHLKIAEAAYRDQLRQGEINTIQNEKAALQANNNALQRENNALQSENSTLLVENTRLSQSHKNNNQSSEAILEDGENDLFIRDPSISPCYSWAYPITLSPSPPLIQDSGLLETDEASTQRCLTGNKNVDEGIDIRAPWACPRRETPQAAAQRSW